jgi:hypothetical protein
MILRPTISFEQIWKYPGHFLHLYTRQVTPTEKLKIVQEERLSMQGARKIAPWMLEDSKGF